MKFAAKGLAVCAVTAASMLAPAWASARTPLPLTYAPVDFLYYSPQLGASLLPPAGFGQVGAQIGSIAANSPLRAMWSPSIGRFHADPGDTIVSLSHIPIWNSGHLTKIASQLRGCVAITIRDGVTGVLYSGSVDLLPVYYP
ncbi:hypothetical protein [Sorangium sp. So ce385]|uniref:hypothetical protein n=1 Tax=Sorangium sp. So ce385 TaxID=3133308 RepID=UPI003F5B5537